MMDALAMRLAAASVQGGLVILVVWVVCRWSGVPARARVWLWWAASLRLCLGLFAMPGIEVPLLPSPEPALPRNAPAPAPALATKAPAIAPAEGLSPVSSPVVSPVIATARSLERATPLFSAVSMLWTAVLLLHVAGLCRVRRQLGRVRAAARRASETLCLETHGLARAAGLRAAPEIRISDEIQSPQVVGVFRPCVLLPSAVVDFPAQERRMALCHELMHVRRRDLPLGWIPALAERLFFFHPLARLAAREYLLAREAACDAAVLRLLHLAPADYARLLVRLGLSRPAVTLAVSAASPTTSALRRRLEMLHQPVVSTRSRLGLSMAVLVAALAWVPVQITTRSVQAAPAADAQDRRPPAEPTVVVGPSSSAPAGANERPTTSPDARFAARTRAAAADASAQDAQAVARALEQEAQARAQAEARAQSEAKQARDLAAAQQELDALAARLRELARATAERREAARRGTQQDDDDPDRAWRQLQEWRRQLALRYTEKHPDRIALEQQLLDLEIRKRDMDALRAELDHRRAELELLERRVAEEMRRYRRAAESALERVLEPTPDPTPEPAPKD